MNRNPGGTARVAMRVTWVLVVALAIVALSATAALAISRSTTLSRAQRWVDYPTKYSQSRYHLGYRTDCSGYVSWCWQTGTSWSTRSFHNVTHRITVAELRPGDALLRKGYHIRLFYGWLDPEHTRYVAYESSSNEYDKSVVSAVRIHSIADDLASGYKPVRYDRISYSPPSHNVLQNGGFATWTPTWTYGQLAPVWWDVGESTPGIASARNRRNVYRSSQRSLELRNSSGDPASVAALSQEASVTPGASYRLLGYALTPNDPAGVEMGIWFLDAASQPLGEATVNGAQTPLTADAFSKMSVTATAPAGAVRAVVAVRLAGGSTPDASGTPIAGTSVIVDDLALYRPHLTSSIYRSRATAYSGSRGWVRGVVTPGVAVDTPVTVWAKRPGSGWVQYATTTVKPSSRGDAWAVPYRFTRSMRRGTHQFRATITGVPGYVGTSTNAVSIRLR